MNETENTETETVPDRRGTFWDWPVIVMILGLAIAILFHATGATVGVVIILFGAVSLMIRRGAFTPRGK